MLSIIIMRGVFATLVVFVTGISAVERRYRGGPVNTTRICGAYDTVPSGDYTLLNNLWGLASIMPKPTGYGCSNIDRRDNFSIAWTANFSWTDYQFYTKGFTCVQQNLGVGQQISNIKSMPTVWNYGVNTTRYPDLTFNIAYDLFTANTSALDAPYTNEIMVWPNTHFMVPVTTFDLLGNPIINTTNLTLGGYTWNFYTGVRNNLPVWSFVNTAGNGDIQPVSVAFKTDLQLFMNYLTSNRYVKTSDHLIVLQAGTEVIKAGATVVKTTFYNTDIDAFPPPKLSSSTSSKKSTSTIKTSSKSSSKSTTTSKPTVKTTSTSKPTKTSSTARSLTRSSAVSSPTAKTWKLVAPCLTDPWPNTLLPKSQQVIFNLTPSICTQACNVGGYIYAGLEFGANCYCGNALNATNGGGVAVAVSQCANVCSGNFTQTCGGLSMMTLYQKL